MPIQVPDEFRQEVLDRGTTGIEDLRQSARTFANSAELRDVMRREGWSPAFIDWYASRASLSGSELDLIVPIRGSYEDEMRNYEKAVANKRARFRNGVRLALAALALAFLSALVTGVDPGHSLVPALWGVGYLVSLGLWFACLALIAESRGRSRWWALLGFSTILAIAVLLLEDRNVPRLPSKTENHEKPDGALLSDW